VGGQISAKAWELLSAMLPNARHVEGNIFGSIGSGLAIEARKRYGAA